MDFPFWNAETSTRSDSVRCGSTCECPNAATAICEALRSTSPTGRKEEQLVQKVFAIKHADVEAIARTLSIFPVPVHPNRELRVIGVSAPAAVMSTIEETIRRLDVPPPAPQNVELTVYLLLASDQEASASSVPAELESVVKQLKTTFAFKGFRTIDTLVVRSRDKQRC